MQERYGIKVTFLILKIKNIIKIDETRYDTE